jgi:glycosyltransferase involved in cell wall biosynthesis
MRLLIWHGYLLGGTGSNVYARSLARAWSSLGHDVTVFCQEPHPERFDVGGAHVVRPEIGLLPVFVLDRYEDLEARLLQDTSWAERRRFVEANAASLREHLPADLLLANHVLLGAPVGVAAGMPFSVKVHGSELEFSLRGNPELSAWARETVAEARVVLAGSEHIRRALGEVIGPGEYLERVRIIPPGVDVEALVPEGREAALAALVEEARRDPPRTSERQPDAGNAERLEEFLAGEEPTVVYVGKLSEEKGVSLLLEALSRLPREVRAVVVGFGPARAELEAQAAGRRVLFTGPLEHRHLAHLWPLADVSVTPSVFPEAFGMVAAEAAACGSPPLVARHSGLAEIAAGLEEEYPPEYRHLASFESGSAQDLTAKLEAILGLSRGEWERLSAASRRAATTRWSWEDVAAEILALG